jgi:hypothetical protein
LRRIGLLLSLLHLRFLFLVGLDEAHPRPSCGRFHFWKSVSPRRPVHRRGDDRSLGAVPVLGFHAISASPSICLTVLSRRVAVASVTSAMTLYLPGEKSFLTR